MITRFLKRLQDSKYRSGEIFSPDVWGGIVNLVNSLVTTGAFGVKYPEMCPSGPIPVGCDGEAVGLAVQAEIPGLKWPLALTYEIHHGFHISTYPYAPETQQVLDLIEFCYREVAKPIKDSWHKEFDHYHLSFDEAAGKQQFLHDINRILARNKLVYKLTDTGQVVKQTSGVPLQKLSAGKFHTGDPTLDEKLDEAYRKFLDPDPSIRRTSVGLLWDCLEKIQPLPGTTTDNKEFLSLLEKEVKTLTEIGDTFHLRHSDSEKSSISNPSQINYLFYRLYGLIQFLFSQEESDNQTAK